MANWLLSGFSSQDSYDERQPDWEGEADGDLEVATQKASEWLGGQSAEACVEVIVQERRGARVVRVVTADGVEDIV